MKKKLVDKLYERKTYLDKRLQFLQENETYPASPENLASKLADQEIELIKAELRNVEEYIIIVLQ